METLMEQAEALLAQAVELAQAGEVQWQEAPIAEAYPAASGSSAKGFIGTTDDLRLVVVSFSIENQGFPPGSLGYDGTLVSGTTVVRMTRKVAEAVHAAASRSHMSPASPAE